MKQQAANFVKPSYGTPLQINIFCDFETRVKLTVRLLADAMAQAATKVQMAARGRQVPHLSHCLLTASRSWTLLSSQSTLTPTPPSTHPPQVRRDATNESKRKRQVTQHETLPLTHQLPHQVPDPRSPSSRQENLRRRQMLNVPLLQSNGIIYTAAAMNTAPVFTLQPGEDGICRPHEADVPLQVEPEFAKTGHGTPCTAIRTIYGRITLDSTPLHCETLARVSIYGNNHDSPRFPLPCTQATRPSLK